MKLKMMMVVLVALAVTNVSVMATEAVSPKRITPKPQPTEDKPFAEHHIVVQVSSDDEKLHKVTLNNIQNASKYYGPDKVSFEVVAYGPGLNLLLKDTKEAERVKSMATSGIKFSACGNTMKSMKKTKADLTEGAGIVPAGVVRIIELQEAGWAYLRP